MSSSDEEDGERSSNKHFTAWRYNKKTKKRTLGIESTGSMTTTTTNGSEVVLDMKGSFYSEKGKARRTINKMLSSPEMLAVLCANRGDIVEIKNVIKVRRYCI